MTIKLKVARSAKELDDVFKLRYEVFINDKKRAFQNQVASNVPCRIVDHFDAIPGVLNIIVYDDNTPVATMRVNKDSKIGLPAEIHFDFSKLREQVIQECKNKQINPMIANAGMLAIKNNWRNRKNVIHAMFKTAISIMYSFQASHHIASISGESYTLYGRLGLEPVGKPQWNKSIADNLIPMFGPFEKFLQWGFGDIYSSRMLLLEEEKFDEKSHTIMTNALNKLERRAISREYLQRI